MKQKVALFLAFDVSYVNSAGDEGIWRYYADLFPSGQMKVYDPCFKVSDCNRRHYFNGHVSTNLTNKGNRYFDLYSMLNEFCNIAVRENFFPFKDLHFGYEDPYVPTIKLLVKMDEGIFEAPISIKSDALNRWISVNTAKKHLTVTGNHSLRTLADA